jgi:HAD superfamily hydrolase (TIGR01484 family)
MKLIISDIDSTLLGHAGALPPENVAALAAAVESGVRLALATVRKHDSAEHVARQLGVPCTLVCSAGAAIFDQDGASLHSLTIPLDLARSLAALADAQGIPLLTTIEEVNYGTPGSHPVSHLSTHVVDVERSLDLLYGPPSRFIAHGAAGIELLMRTFADAPLRFVRHYNPDGTLYNAAITHASASKEAALILLCQQWAIDFADVLALGDSESDIGMIQIAGVGVAMGNAHPAVKAVADWVAPNASDAGVAAAVRKFVLNTT